MDAAGSAREALDSITGLIGDVRDALSELRSVQEEYEEWRDNLPENLRSSALGEKLDTVCDLDIESGTDQLESVADELDSLISEAEGADLPQGFGRD